MVTKIRKQIYIEPDQEVLLKRLSDETGLSEAEFIRQAINEHVRLFQYTKPVSDVWTQEKDFIIYLMNQKLAVNVQSKGRSWQREDLYKR